MKQEIEHYFTTNSNDVCFSTSNKLIFHNEHNAIAHGNGLEDKNVQKHERADYPAGEVAVEEVVAAVEEAEAEGTVEALPVSKSKSKK